MGGRADLIATSANLLDTNYKFMDSMMILETPLLTNKPSDSSWNMPLLYGPLGKDTLWMLLRKSSAVLPATYIMTTILTPVRPL